MIAEDINRPNRQVEDTSTNKSKEPKQSIYLQKSKEDLEVQAPDNYDFIRTIGDGSFGKVKLGVHKLTAEKVAIKILYKQRIKEKTDIERISRQIKIMKVIRHPFLVQTYEIIQSPKYLFLVMEYVQGGDLFDAISNNGKLTEDISKQYFSQILLGLEYLHSVGITHRDMKPENILLNQYGKIKIADFGLGNFFSEDQKLKTACGSPCYAPPQMLNQQEYDPRKVDIWSSGVILYAMVHGYLPFQDDVQSLLYQKIKTKNVRFASYISVPCRNLLRGLLIKDQKERWSTDTIKVHEFLSATVDKELQYVKMETEEVKLQEFSQICEYLGITEQDQNRLLNNIKKNKHNNLTTLYYLGKKRLLREIMDKKEVQSSKQMEAQLEKQEKSQVFDHVQINPLANSDRKPFSFFDRDEISSKFEEKTEEPANTQMQLIQSKLIQNELSRINQNSLSYQIQKSQQSLSSINAKTPDSNNQPPVPRSPPQEFIVSPEQSYQKDFGKIVEKQEIKVEELVPTLKIGKKNDPKPTIGRSTKTQSFKKQPPAHKNPLKGNLKKSQRMPIYKPKQDINKINQSDLKLYERSHSKDRPIVLQKNFRSEKSSVLKDKKTQTCSVTSKKIHVQPHLIDCQRLTLLTPEKVCQYLSKKGLMGRIQYYSFSKQCIFIVKSQLKPKPGSRLQINVLQKIINQVNQLASVS